MGSHAFVAVVLTLAGCAASPRAVASRTDTPAAPTTVTQPSAAPAPSAIEPATPAAPGPFPITAFATARTFWVVQKSRTATVCQARRWNPATKMLSFTWVDDGWGGNFPGDGPAPKPITVRVEEKLQNAASRLDAATELGAEDHSPPRKLHPGVGGTEACHCDFDTTLVGERSDAVLTAGPASDPTAQRAWFKSKPACDAALAEVVSQSR